MQRKLKISTPNSSHQQLLLKFLCIKSHIKNTPLRADYKRIVLYCDEILSKEINLPLWK